MKEFKYLGYVMQRNGRQKTHVRDRMKRAAVIMGQVWRKGKEDLERIVVEDYGLFLTD